MTDYQANSEESQATLAVVVGLIILSQSIHARKWKKGKKKKKVIIRLIFFCRTNELVLVSCNRSELFSLQGIYIACRCQRICSF